ncbi:MAG: AraC-like DNA-binding protein [Parasphingorhabdus sp.]|jgi:AraC-like DNA-binding protein
MDVLSDVFATLRLSGTVYFQADFCSPWGMDIKGGNVANFHLVVAGECWLRQAGKSEVVKLQTGDIALFPHGDRHALLHPDNAEILPAERVLNDLQDEQKSSKNSDKSIDTTLICGHYDYDRSKSHPLLDSLPQLVHLKASKQSEWMLAASKLTVAESQIYEQGSNAVVNRLAETLLVQLVRYLANKNDYRSGFLALLGHPKISKAIQLIHEKPHHPWRLEDLADACGVSRTVLSDEFSRCVDLAPIQYLTEWRMHKARDMFVCSQMSVAQVAEHVGYSSEGAFSSAYKRVFGERPGVVRQAKHAH